MQSNKEQTLKVLQETLELLEMSFRAISKDMNDEQIESDDNLEQIRLKITDIRESIEWVKSIDSPVVESLDEAAEVPQDQGEFFIPEDLDQAVDALLNSIQNPDDIKKETEQSFTAYAHHGMGRWIRNTWGLWWDEKSGKPKPKLLEYFNDLGIYHPDDMSGIILTTFYRKLTDKDINLNSQVQKYKDFWENDKDNLTI